MKQRVRIALKQTGELQVKGKGKPRGRPFGKNNTAGFKKGKDPNRNMQGRPPAPYRPFADRLKEELAKPAPVELAAAVGLRTHATKYDVVIAAMLHNCMRGDVASQTALRNIIEGLLPNRNLNVSVSMQRYLEDPEFQEYLNQQHSQFLQYKGETNAERPGFETALRQLPAPTADEGSGTD